MPVEHLIARCFIFVPSESCKPLVLKTMKSTQSVLILSLLLLHSVLLRGQLPEMGSPQLLWENELPDPTVIAVEDFDGDGLADILIKSGQFTSAIIWNNGDGFSQPEIFDQSYDYISLSPLDIDEDGDLDLVLGTTNPFIFWKENLGARNFELQFLANGFLMGAEDMDNDGDKDLLIRESFNSLSYLPLEGTTALESVSIAEGLIDTPNEIFVRDFDGNGRADIVYQATANLLKFQMQEDDGLSFFSDSCQVALGVVPDWEFADFDNDGQTEILAFAKFLGQDTSMFVIKRQSQGNFEQNAGPWWSSASDCAVADVDADGNLDIFVSSTFPHNVHVLAGGGDLTFGEPELLLENRKSQDHIFASDLNGDDKADLLATSSSSGMMKLKYTGIDEAAITLFEPDIGRIADLLVADIGADGSRDLILSSPDTDRILRLQGLGNCSFGSAETYLEANGAGDIKLMQLDAGPEMELVRLNYWDYTIDYFSLTESSPNIEILIPALGSIKKIYVDDLNADSHDDLVTLSFDSKVHVYPGLADGELDVQRLLHLPMMIDAKEHSATDLWFPKGPEQRMIIKNAFDVMSESYIEKSDLQDWQYMDTEFITSTLSRSESVIGDIDGNGYEDLIVKGGCPQQTVAYREETTYELATGETTYPAILFANLDGDAQLDAISKWCYALSGPIYYVSDDELPFGEEILFEDRYLINEIIANDLDQDGDDDLLYIAENRQKLLLVENLTNSTSIDQPYEFQTRVSPNPTSGQLHVSSMKAGVAELYSMNGHLLKQVLLEKGSNDIVLQGLPNGLYFLHSGADIHKIILQAEGY